MTTIWRRINDDRETIEALIDQCEEGVLTTGRSEAYPRVMNPEMRRITVEAVLQRLRESTRKEEAARGRTFGQRIELGQCAILGGWCLTHNTEAHAGHSHDINGGTLD